MAWVATAAVALAALCLSLRRPSSPPTSQVDQRLLRLTEQAIEQVQQSNEQHARTIDRVADVLEMLERQNERLERALKRIDREQDWQERGATDEPDL